MPPRTDRTVKAEKTVEKRFTNAKKRSIIKQKNKALKKDAPVAEQGFQRALGRCERATLRFGYHLSACGENIRVTPHGFADRYPRGK